MCIHADGKSGRNQKFKSKVVFIVLIYTKTTADIIKNLKFFVVVRIS